MMPTFTQRILPRLTIYVILIVAGTLVYAIGKKHLSYQVFNESSARIIKLLEDNRDLGMNDKPLCILIDRHNAEGVVLLSGYMSQKEVVQTGVPGFLLKRYMYDMSSFEELCPVLVWYYGDRILGYASVVPEIGLSAQPSMTCEVSEQGDAFVLYFYNAATQNGNTRLTVSLDPLDAAQQR